jgi:AbrB family looped-hinge helix DNA binding protein
MDKHTTERKLVRIKQKGQVTLPSGMRKALGLKEGDLVEVTRTADGLRITPQEVVAMHALDEVERVLQEKGITLADVMASGRESSGELIQASEQAKKKASTLRGFLSSAAQEKRTNASKGGEP